jgi:hypothetical protein
MDFKRKTRCQPPGEQRVSFFRGAFEITNNLIAGGVAKWEGIGWQGLYMRVRFPSPPSDRSLALLGLIRFILSYFRSCA